MDRLPAFLRPPAREIRSIWRLFKEFAKLTGEALEIGGDALVAGAVVGAAAAEFFLKRVKLFVGGAFVAAFSSPIMDGYGIEWLNDAPLGVWAPLGAYPLAVTLLWLLLKVLIVLNREGERDSLRSQRERLDPGIAEVLSGDARKLIRLNAQLDLDADLPPLEDQSFCHDLIVEALRRIRARGPNRDVALVLQRDIDGSGFAVVESVGRIDREVQAALELGDTMLDAIDSFLTKRLEPFQYRGEPIDFPVGRRHYVLIVTSGATISDDVLAEVSSAAVRLLDEYVWAMRRRRSMEDRG